MRPPLDGILLVDKPDGLTSAQVVARVKRTLGQKKVGHLGTLDPFATGLLPICIGEGTKVAQFMVADDKRYVGEIVVGVATDTLDRTGAVVERRDVGAFGTAELACASAALRGEQLQTPPMYSALKRAGVPLYRLARAGEEVSREPRPVTIFAFDVARVAADRIAFAVHCSKGTYVRVLAQDLGRALGTVAHLASLRRTGFGVFDVRSAVTLETIAAIPPESLPLLSTSAALGSYRAVVADDATITALRQGRQQALAVLGRPRAIAEVVRIESAAGDLVAVAAAAEPHGTWRLARVIAH